MKQSNDQTVYWTKLRLDEWKMYVAATDEGLCYVGSHDAGFDELTGWVNKKLPDYTLSENEQQLKPYLIELVDYLTGKRKTFNFKLDLHGTDFQQRVWHVLQKIPYGKTVSYKDIADQIDKPKAARAVGTAIGANPVLITVPCHRVIAKGKKLTGYRGGLAMKQQLLDLEK